MRKTELSTALRQYVRENLSPRPEERELVSKLYISFQDLLGKSNCFQIGSYPRFTAITPLHDLDILYVVGNWTYSVPDPADILRKLQERIKKEYKNPTKYELVVELQTHSITVTYLDNKKEIFSIDIIPAYARDKNEFEDDKYMVPEIISEGHSKRKRIYEEISKGIYHMNWIKSDPKGYIELARRTDAINNDFRKAVKFIKGWRSACKRYDENFKLKSFHIEQIVFNYFSQSPSIEVFDAIFYFFCDLPIYLEEAQISDRADNTRKVDEYIDQLTYEEKQSIIQARDYFLIKFENLIGVSNIADLLQVGFHKRASVTEEYLFDSRIPVLLQNEERLKIQGRILPRAGGFRERILDVLGLIEVDRKIEFRIVGDRPQADVFKWKVKNDDSSKQPRGEIVDNSTLNDPENTKFKGKHYVECYAIRNGVCIARARQNVVLDSVF